MILTPLTEPLDRQKSNHLLMRLCYNGSISQAADLVGLDPAQAVATLLTPKPHKVYSYEKNAGQNIEDYFLGQIDSPAHYEGKAMSFVLAMFPSWIKNANKGTAAAWLTLLNFAVYADYEQVLEFMPADMQMGSRLDIGKNQNYAREAMEVFSLGGGNYTQGDVEQLSRVYTGWNSVGNFADASKYNPVLGVRQANSVLEDHDKGDKQFSSFFNNQVIKSSTPAEEAKAAAAMIMSHPAMGRHLMKKLHMFYLADYPAPEVIDEMVQIWKEGGHRLAPVLQALCSSSYFYEARFFGTKVLTPIELFFKMINWLGAGDFDLTIYVREKGILSKMGQSPFNPSEIFGYPADYQPPSLNWLWLNGSSLPARFDIDKIVNGNWLYGLVSFDDPSEVVSKVAEWLLPAAADDKILDNWLLWLLDGGSARHWNGPDVSSDDRILQLKNLAVKIAGSAEIQLM